MNLFVAGFDSSQIDLAAMRRAMDSFTARVPFLDASATREWRSGDGRAAAVWLSHDPQQLSGIDYAHAADDDVLALFSGRPIAWGDGGRADGRGALDPRRYTAPAAGWAESLDGSFTVVRYDARSGLEVVTSPMGSYPVYAAEAGSRHWVSNRPALLTSLLPRVEQDDVAIAHFLATGWALGGGSLWRGVRLLDRARIHRFQESGHSAEAVRGANVPSLAASFGAGLDPDRAAGDLVESVRAAADWPGRPNIVFLSGGLDSRLILAAAVRSESEFEARTVADPGLLGYPETGDVVVARRLAELCSLRHTVVSTSSLQDDLATHARLVRLLTNGLVSLGDSGPVRVADPGVPLDQAFSGKAGELSRTFYGLGKTGGATAGAQLFEHVVPRWPEPLVNDEGKQLVRSFVDGWAERQLAEGASVEDIPDLFYALERLPHWAAPSHMSFEQKNDTVMPLWFGRIAPHQVAPSAAERQQELFHYQVLSALSPELARADFDGTNPPWPVFGTSKPSRRRDAEVFARKAARELRRRARARLRRSQTAASDPFVSAMAETRRGVAANADHPVWRYVDRGRVTGLLDSQPLSLDPRTRRLVWRLAAVFQPD